MNYKIRTYPLFEKEVKRLGKRYKSLKQDLMKLVAELLEKPESGVNLGSGIHKVRMSIASKGKGKSAGARVITVILDLAEVEKEIGLHYIYDKSDRENLTEKEMELILRSHGII